MPSFWLPLTVIIPGPHNDPALYFCLNPLKYLYLSLHKRLHFMLIYSIIFIMLPAPIVLPPSRIANRSPSSMAMGAISFTSISIWSPGIIISTPSGRETSAVTSVVLK